MSETETGTSSTLGPANIREVGEYAVTMDKIFDDFKKWVKKDRNDALPHTIDILKKHMRKTFPQMGNTNKSTIL